MARSGEDSPCAPCMRKTELVDGSDKTSDGFGGVSRPFVTEGKDRLDDLMWSVELLRADVGF